MKTKNLITSFASLCLVLFVSSANGSVSAMGQRTIHQSLEDHNATDLHFIAYQADRTTAWIEGWDIDISVPYTSTTQTADDWPFDDWPKKHSVTADFNGMSVPYCTNVAIDVNFTLNEYNTVKFADMYWTYDDHDPVDIMPANVGWGFNTTPGSSPGKWVISKYTIRDMAGNIVAVDLVGHENSTTDNPSLGTMFIENGKPSNPGNESIKITDWGRAEVDDLPTWEEIDSWPDWDIFVPGVVIGPGESIPEPATVVLLGLGGLMLFRRRKA